MRVVLPYTHLHPATVRRANTHLPTHTRVRLNPNDPTAYQTLLARLWADRRTFLLVEHDIGVHAGVAAQLDHCRSAWCAFAYPGPGRMLYELGCTRFRVGLLASEPDVFAEIDTLPFDGLPRGDWRRLDVRLADVLARRGWARCVHTPPVEHYHTYP